MGTIYIDVHGTLEVTNLTKNIKALINISKQGWTARDAYKVEGSVVDANEIPRCEIAGKWNEYLTVKDIAQGKEEEVFRAIPKPENAERIYGFSKFACNLNYINDEMKLSLPPTDTRRRPD